MAKRRVQSETGLRLPSLNVTAQPVDMFEQTAEGQKLSQLAHALGELAPSVARLSGVVTDRQNEEAKRRGEAEARRLFDQGMTFAQAIKDGKITADKSPFFMAGLKEQFGRIAADRWQAQLMVDVPNDLSEATSIEEYDAYTSKHRQDWIEKNVPEGKVDEYFEAGFGPRSDAYYADLRRSFASDVTRRMLKTQNDQHGQEVYKILEIESSRGTSREAIAAAVTQLSTDALRRNPKAGKALSRATVDAVIAYAKRANDVSMLEVLRSVKGADNGPLLHRVPEYAEMIEGAENQIGAENDRRYNREHQKQTREIEQRREAVLSDAIKALEADPEVDLKSFRERMLEADPMAVNLLYDMQNAYAGREYVDDEEAVADAFNRIHTVSPGQAGYFRKLDASVLLGAKRITPQTFRTMMADIEQRDQAGSSEFASDPYLNQGKARTRALFVAEYGESSADERFRAEQAQAAFAQRYIAWRRGAGKDADRAAVESFLEQTVLDVFVEKGAERDILDANSNFPNLNLMLKREISGAGAIRIPDWKTEPAVARAGVLDDIEFELKQIREKKRTTFSESTRILLNSLSVPPQDVEAFIAAQRKLVPR